jgi:hypothetical protein
MKHLKHLKYTLATWALLRRMEARWRRSRRRHVDLVMRQRQGQPAGGCSITRILSPSPACWSIHRGGSLAAHQLGGGNRGERACRCEEATWSRQARQMGLGGEAAPRRQCGGGHIGWGATLWGPAVARRSVVGGWARTGRADRVTGRAAHAGVSLNCIIIDIKRLLGVALRPV